MTFQQGLDAIEKIATVQATLDGNSAMLQAIGLNMVTKTGVQELFDKHDEHVKSLLQNMVLTASSSGSSAAPSNSTALSATPDFSVTDKQLSTTSP